ncbi:MAG: hypothetical protein GXO98_01875 [Nitrospirae bacterium]|nr:hypothetical protein [Nitrospirota bacterium]
MLCEICNKKEATVHYTEIISDEMTEMHLCEDCAREKGAMIKPHFPLADLLAGLTDFKVPLTVKEGKSEKCPHCGLSYADFRKIGRLGCGQCYYTFRDGLSSLLKRVHGSCEHVGKVPALAGGEVAKVNYTLKELRKRLQQAIQREAFEEAARLRDQIRGMEKK